MAVEKAPPCTSLIDVLDRVLDKGIVVDAWVRIPLVGIDLTTVEAPVEKRFGRAPDWARPVILIILLTLLLLLIVIAVKHFSSL